MPMNPRLLRPLASGYRYASLRKGLVAYWPMNETAASGDVLVGDETGRGNHLGSSGSVLSTTGKVGNGRELVAANSEYLFRDSNTDLQFGDGDWSIAAWVFPQSTGTGEGFIVGKDQSGGREFLFSASTNTSTTANKVTATVFHTDGTNVSVAGPSASNADFLGKWYHAVVVHSSGVVSLYLDGVLASGSGSTPTVNRASGKTFAATSTQFNVGRRSFSGFPNHLDAVVDELAKWNRALSAAEVSTLYNNGNGIDLSAPRKTFAPFPGVSNAETLDWINRVYSNGGTVSTSTANAVDAFCNAIDAAGIRDRFYRLNLFAGTGLNAALVPLYRGPTFGGTTYGNATDTNLNFVSGDYSETSGLLGNGSNKALNTGFPANTIAAADRHSGFGLLATSTGSAGNRFLSSNWNGGSNSMAVKSRSSVAGDRSAIFTRFGTASDTFGDDVGSGHLAVGNIVASWPTMYRDGVATGTDATTSADYPSAHETPIFCQFTTSNYTTPGSATNARLGWYSIGEVFTAQQVADFDSAISAFYASVGRS